MRQALKSICPFAWFLLGVVIGFLLAPSKNGCGNNSGNTSHYYGKGEGEIPE